MRLNLAQALMCRSDLLLLDEPTNHLDLDAIVWLEDWLHRYPGTLVIISHDREFLDAVCDVTLHLENRQVKRYGGNYSQFEVLRAQQLELQQSAYEKQQKTIAHLQSFVDRFKAKASKAKQAQSRVKALEKMERIAPAHIASPFTFEFRTPDSAPNPMLVMENVRCGYRADDGGEIPIVERVALSIQNGQRIGLLGANGQGKSTLIKTLAGTLAPLSGELRTGRGLTIGYFAQHQLETLREDDSALAHLARLAPDTREQELRDFLGGFNFSGEMATAPIAPFSGGEKARLALALIIWRKPNLLLLDEPTNHLDLETRHPLTMALAQFEGTLILVSHDRHLLRATTDQFMLVAKHRLQPFDGDLDDYRDWLLQHAAEQRAAAKAACGPGGAAASPAGAVGDGGRPPGLKRDRHAAWEPRARIGADDSRRAERLLQMRPAHRARLRVALEHGGRAARRQCARRIGLALAVADDAVCGIRDERMHLRKRDLQAGLAAGEPREQRARGGAIVGGAIRADHREMRREARHQRIERRGPGHVAREPVADRVAAGGDFVEIRLMRLHGSPSSTRAPGGARNREFTRCAHPTPQTAGHLPATGEDASRRVSPVTHHVSRVAPHAARARQAANQRAGTGSSPVLRTSPAAAGDAR